MYVLIRSLHRNRYYCKSTQFAVTLIYLHPFAATKERPFRILSFSISRVGVHRRQKGSFVTKSHTCRHNINCKHHYSCHPRDTKVFLRKCTLDATKNIVNYLSKYDFKRDRESVMAKTNDARKPISESQWGMENHLRVW